MRRHPGRISVPPGLRPAQWPLFSFESSRYNFIFGSCARDAVKHGSGQWLALDQISLHQPLSVPLPPQSLPAPKSGMAEMPV